jgi:heat shock protein HslJ
MILKRSMMTLVVIAVLTVVLAACDGSGANALRDTAWELASLAGSDVLPGTTITVKFATDEVSGSAGCNTYGGSYTASEDSLGLSGVYATEMGCLEPAGILEQEQAYLTALRVAARYQIDGDRLEILDETGAQILAFVASSSEALVVATPTLEQPSPVPATPTAEILEATPTPTIKPPAGFKQYQDSVVGVSVFVPESWVVVEVDPGRLAILQSYPEDKYIGGEAREPGDTKCDLTIRPPDFDVVSHIQGLKSDPTVTIVSEQEIVLQSGKPGTRFEVDSMGRSLSLFTEVNERVVVLTCFGELAPFDQIAVTLGAGE